MDESVEVIVSDATNATSNMVAASSILGVIKRFIGVFVLSEEEKLAAGINSDYYHDARQAEEQPDPAVGYRSKGRIG